MHPSSGAIGDDIFDGGGWDSDEGEVHRSPDRTDGWKSWEAVALDNVWMNGVQGTSESAALEVAEERSAHAPRTR